MLFIKRLALFFIILFSVIYHTHAKTVRIAMYEEPPFAILKGGKFTGENIKLARLFASSIGADINVLHCPFARCMSMVKTGQADMVFGIKRTKAREQDYAFLDQPYRIQHFPLNFYTLKAKKLTISSYQDLAKLTVGMLRGGVYFEPFDHDNSITKVPVTSRAQLIDLLLKGRIDTFLEREESVLPLIEDLQQQAEITSSDYMFDQEVEVHVALSKQSFIYQYRDLLSNNLNSLIKNGEIEKIFEARLTKQQTVVKNNDQN